MTITMFTPGPYVHNIDPIIGSILGVHLWWYGLSYTLGFLNAHMFIKRRRDTLGLSLPSVYSLSLLLAGGVLLGGRAVEVVFYEWSFYGAHLYMVPFLWLGGMATHGLLLGGVTGIFLFCRLYSMPFLKMLDVLAIPAAFILAMGRIGNFIDGQIVGSITTVWWAVKFPDADGFRHPVVLYDGIKNLLIIPVLMYAGKRQLPTGVITGIFLFLYSFLRIFVDIYREYPTTLLGLATGQVLNILLSLLGLALIVTACWKKHGRAETTVTHIPVEGNLMSAGIGWRRFLYVTLLLFSLTIPSDWTQDIPGRYGTRHPALHHSALYPDISNTLQPGADFSESVRNPYLYMPYY